MKLNRAEDLAIELLYKHGLGYYNLKFDNATRRFGQCNAFTKTINLSKPLTLVNSEEVVKDTILHEIAHALDYKIHGNIGHGITWKSLCLEVGCRPNALCGTEDGVVFPKAKYLKTCPNCGPRGPAHRRRKNTACGACCNKLNGGKYSKEYLIQYNLNAI
jgi:predicted SprT family Zn-dependent metalloprotease